MTRITVLVVDDSVVIRRLVTDALSSDPEIDVVGVAANGQIALGKVEQLKPDVVTMDIEMPEMDGIEAVRALRAAGHRMPIIMFSTLTARGASATLDALSAGATDYVTKPANVGSVQESMARVAGDLIPRIKTFVGRTARTGVRRSAVIGAAAAAPQRPVTLRPAPPVARRPRAVLVGSSTGGPAALATLVAGFTHVLPVPVLVVQHMPPVFTTQLAARLDRIGPNTVVEAATGQELVAGTIYLAPGDHHLEVVRSAGGGRTRLHQGPAENYCRPAVDVLFRTAAKAFGGDLLAVVLTGMGSDGRIGSQAVVDAGGVVLVQDEASSVVWGMPGSVANAGLAHTVLPMDEIAGAVLHRLTREPSAAGATR